MRRLWDISLALGPGTPAWPGDPPVTVAAASRIASGDPANVSALGLGSHAGTHIDPPAHFLDGGVTADQVSLEALIGEAVVVEIPRATGAIGPEDIEGADLDGATRVLFKTGNSARWRGWGSPERPEAEPWVGVSAEAARWLVDRGVALVGIDALSIEPPDSPGFPTHLTLLRAGVVIVEGLDLTGVPPGTYRLLCLPLRLEGGDGAPARAVLEELQ
jgi:arylformamidase